MQPAHGGRQPRLPGDADAKVWAVWPERYRRWGRRGIAGPVLHRRYRAVATRGGVPSSIRRVNAAEIPGQALTSSPASRDLAKQSYRCREYTAVMTVKRSQHRTSIPVKTAGGRLTARTGVVSAVIPTRGQFEVKYIDNPAEMLLRVPPLR